MDKKVWQLNQMVDLGYKTLFVCLSKEKAYQVMEDHNKEVDRLSALVDSWNEELQRLNPWNDPVLSKKMKLLTEEELSTPEYDEIFKPYDEKWAQYKELFKIYVLGPIHMVAEVEVIE